VEAACVLPEVTEVLVDFLEARGVPIALAAIKSAGKIAVAVSPRVIKVWKDSYGCYSLPLVLLQDNHDFWLSFIFSSMLQLSIVQASCDNFLTYLLFILSLHLNCLHQPDEEGLGLWLLDLEADALLVRSAGLLQQLRNEKQRRLDLGVPTNGGYATSSNCAEDGSSSSSSSDISSGNDKIRFPKWPSLRGDFSLNFANALSAAHLLDTCSLDALTPAHDLNADQLAALQMQLTALSSEDDGNDDAPPDGVTSSSSTREGGGLLEVVMHQHLPVFHTEHCVFCRFLSDGSSYKDCGHPCETSQVHLRSTETGDDHLVLADMG